VRNRRISLVLSDSRPSSDVRMSMTSDRKNCRTWLAKLYLGSLSDVLREYNRMKSRLGGGHYGAPDVPSGYSIVPMSSGSHAAGNTVIPKFDMHIFTSTMTVNEVNNIAEEYGIPLDLHPYVPSSTLTMVNLPMVAEGDGWDGRNVVRDAMMMLVSGWGGREGGGDEWLWCVVVEMRMCSGSMVFG
nr:hypothetical protein [Tanacetum cinerariifolium]